MGQKGRTGFCGCCSLRTGGIITGLLACVYNGALVAWFTSTAAQLSSSDDLFQLYMTLLVVLSVFAAFHISLSILLVYAILKNKPELVVLWVVTYAASCLVVATLFTIGLAFMLNTLFLLIVFCNILFVFNVIMVLRLYREIVENIKTEAV